MITRFVSLGLLLVLLTVVVKGDLPALTVVAGNNYDAGYTIGRTFSDRIRSYIGNSSSIQGRLLPFLRTPTGKTIVDDYVQLNQVLYPHLYDELLGLADGAGVSIDYINLINLSNELSAVLAFETTEDSACTDLTLNTNDVFIHGHNEDADPLVAVYAYWVNVTINGNTFSAYSYPGHLPGNAFGVNSKGLILTTNALSPSNVVVGGIARAFINRDVLDSVDLDDAIKRTAPTAPRGGKGRSLGFNLNALSVDEHRAVSVEVSPLAYSVVDLVGNNSHYNNYKYLTVPQIAGASSIHRSAVVDKFPAPASSTDILRILGDQSDAQYPIYRTATPPDSGYTVATALFDLNARVVDIYLANPANSVPATSVKF